MGKTQEGRLCQWVIYRRQSRMELNDNEMYFVSFKTWTKRCCYTDSLIMRSSLFWEVTWCRLAAGNRRFGIALTALPLKIAPRVCPELSITSCQTTPHHVTTTNASNTQVWKPEMPQAKNVWGESEPCGTDFSKFPRSFIATSFGFYA